METDGFKIESDFGYASTKSYSAASAEAPSFSLTSDCYGTALVEPAKSGAYSNYKSSNGERPLSVHGVTVLGESSN